MQTLLRYYFTVFCSPLTRLCGYGADVKNPLDWFLWRRVNMLRIYFSVLSLYYLITTSLLIQPPLYHLTWPKDISPFAAFVAGCSYTTPDVGTLYVSPNTIFEYNTVRYFLGSVQQVRASCTRCLSP